MFRKTVPVFLNGTLPSIPATRCLVKMSTVLHVPQHFCHNSNRRFSNTKRHQIDEQQIKEDYKLQQSYQSSFFPRSLKALKLLFPSEKEKLTNLMRNKVIPSDDDENLVGSNLYLDLQHPLLLKYNFNPIDFNTNAAQAFIPIRKAISTLEAHAPHINEEYNNKASIELLKGALAGPLFTLYMKSFEVMDKPANTRKIIKDLTIKSATMTRIATDIVDDIFYESAEAMYKILYRRVGGSLMAMKGQSPGGSELNEEVIDKWIKDIQVDRIYPNGSVIAIVEVSLELEETGIQIVGHGKEAIESEFVHQKSTLVGFQGCISGQVPLKWLNLY